MEGSFRRPESKMVKPKRAPDPSSQEAEARQEQAEYAVDQQKIEQRKKEQEDQVGTLLGSKYFIQQWTDPILLDTDRNIQMTVSRFYPEVNVAMDIYPFIGPDEKRDIELKRKIFSENPATHAGIKIKVRYGALSYSDPLANLMPQLER